MRVAHVITRMILGGAQENTLLTCEDLARDYGDDVLLVTGPPLGPEGSLLARAEAHRVPLSVIPSLRRAIHPWRDLVAYRELKRRLAEFRPDVVHTHSAKGGVLGRMAATAIGAPAIVHTVHGAPFHPYQSPLARAFFRRCERYAARRCHAIVSVADAMTELLVGAGVAPRDKFTTIHSGMEVEPFLAADATRGATRAALGFRPEHVVVGKVARLFHLKGHQYVIRAARELVARQAETRFLFVGDGVLRAPLERQVAQAGLGEVVRFVGLVPPDEIPKYLAAMDIVVHASLREGLARVLPQALVAGKPVVSFDVDGAREVVLHGTTGLLVPPCDARQLAEAIGLLVMDPAMRAQFGAEGRRRFTDQFRHARMTRELRALYERLLECKAVGRQ
ncbi:MAG: glycosyltransferase family 4 protein [Planctomycetia bacterium]|nr:glycosyltransferase family 4 protein [Planctomycetia bacterium]